MRTVLENDYAVWLPGETTGVHDIYRVLDGASDLQLTVTVPRGAAEPGIEVDDLGGVLRVRVDAVTETKITVIGATRDAVAVWRPGSHRDHARVAANWEPAETISPLHGSTLGALVGPADLSLLTFGATAGEHPVELQAGVSEETAEFMVSFTVADVRSGVTSLTVWVDRAGAEFSRSIQDMADRIYGESVPLVSDADERPVFSTWYVFHQELAQAEVVSQGEAAVELGFGTVIVDDGWQSTDTQRGYGTTGDWLIEPTKFPEARRLVDALAERGLRTMWWVGTPFIGDRSLDVDRFPVLARETQIEASVFDPRSPAARAHLTERIVALVSETGAHGVKLDFVERFAQVGRHRDEVEAAAVSLIREIRRQLDDVSPGASVEFREPYIGPVATRLATMIRVNDCPMSPVRNRVGVIDLRLSTRGVAVHADPIMWAEADSSERVAIHLMNALFAVPQVSVDLLALSDAHRDVLRFWIGFHNTHRSTLLHGDLRAARPDLNYPVVTARDADTVITARYQPTAVVAPQGSWGRWLIANTEADPTDIRSSAAVAGSVQIVIRDARGGVASTTVFDGIPPQLVIPVGGLAEVIRRW